MKGWRSLGTGSHMHQETSHSGMLSQGLRRGTAVREIKEIHAEYMYVWCVWHFGKDRMGTNAAPPDGCERHLASLVVPARSSPVCVCVSHANVGACGCKLHMARRHRGGRRTKRRQTPHGGNWDTAGGGSAGLELGSESSLLPLWARSGPMPQWTCL